MNVSEFEPTSCREVYEAISTRQLTALMFHNEMADFFNFLGLYGFQAMHEYQYVSESLGYRSLKRYYMSNHNMILPSDEVESIDVIPDDWYKYTKDDVSPIVRKQAVQRALEEYRDWEVETKALYERCAHYLFEWHKIADFDEINNYIRDVSEEIKWLKQLCLELKATDYDSASIIGMQCYYKDCYEKKARRLVVEVG